MDVCCWRPSEVLQLEHPQKIGGIYSNPSVSMSMYQWLFLVPLKGGRWHIIPQLAVYTTYILPSGGLYATYHLLGEPETTIECIFGQNPRLSEGKLFGFRGTFDFIGGWLFSSSQICHKKLGEFHMEGLELLSAESENRFKSQQW